MGFVRMREIAITAFRIDTTGRWKKKIITIQPVNMAFLRVKTVLYVNIRMVNTI
tara:strand:+ start:89 stop:250 length:162 start_codon:yes stop_codon:yes gene_type:complete